MAFSILSLYWSTIKSKCFLNNCEYLFRFCAANHRSIFFTSILIFFMTSLKRCFVILNGGEQHKNASANSLCCFIFPTSKCLPSHWYQRHVDQEVLRFCTYAFKMLKTSLFGLFAYLFVSVFFCLICYRINSKIQ